MIRLLNKTNVSGATTDLPFGSTRDNPGDNTGTPLNKSVLGDYFQFFEKMFAQSGLTANNMPDNATNGFQLFDALLATVGPNVVPTFATDYAGDPGYPLVARKIPGRQVNIRGRVGSAGGADLAANSFTLLFTLPVGFRPVAFKDGNCFCAVNNKFYRVRIETDGTVLIKADGSATPSYNLRFDFSFSLD